MTTTAACAWALLLVTACSGCAGGDAGGDDSGDSADGGIIIGSDGGGTTDGGSAEFIAPDGDRVLLYYGHGGMAPSTTGKASFNDVELRWDALGFNLHHKNTLADDLSIYRMIGLVAPGSEGDASFSADEVSRLSAARAQGTRLVILGDPTMCDDPGVASLFDDLATDAGFSGEGADDNQILTASDVAEHQLTAGVASVSMRDPCFALVGRGQAVLSDQFGTVLASAHRPSDGGDIVVLGDLEVLDDGWMDQADNALFADNLARVTP